MAMKPQLIKLLEAMKALGLKPMHQLSPVAAREQMEAGVRARNQPLIELGSIEERSIPGPAGDIPVRIYRPEGAATAQGGPLGALVYYHGGGHVIGSMDTHDYAARAMCRDANIVVLSVDYRMGPEAKFPAAVDDCYAATKWLADNAESMGVRADRIAVGGDSAGGNLALVVALMARDTDDSLSIAYQLLVYPVMDYTGGTPSYETYGIGYGPLQAASVPYFRGHYLNSDDELADWRASPARAASPRPIDHGGMRYPQSRGPGMRRKAECRRRRLRARRFRRHDPWLLLHGAAAGRFHRCPKAGRRPPARRAVLALRVEAASLTQRYIVCKFRVGLENRP
jgi:acetyl esterase